MDAFDAVRRAAAELHDLAVSRGANPLRASEIVQSAAEVLDVELHALPIGNPSLHGALALFDPQTRLICYADDGSPVEQALLIGHELGHARQDAAASICEQPDIDLGASIEQAPVGLERVTDYGARERRELHANVFARELLLPMPLARRLYLDEKLSGSEVATQTGLPPTLVRQQLLDAILLPRPPERVEEPKDEPPLDPSQEAAAYHSGSAYNLQAGPGTGKTRTLVERVRRLIAQGVDPAAILVLTFSNKAAGELAERFATVVPNEAPRIWTGTFHAFGLDLIRRFHDRFGLSNDPRLFDRSDAIAALQEALPTLPLRHYLNLWRPAQSLREILFAISRAKDELADSRRYKDLAAAMLGGARDPAERELAEKCYEIAQVYERYDVVLQNADAVDFGDLIMRPTVLLESDEKLQAQLRERHQHVLVDEYQDVNRASARLLKAIAGRGTRLWVVGDARQSIYRFRGASPINLRSFNADFAGESGQLAVNYRSTEQIVNAVCAIAENMQASDDQLPLRLRANRGTGPAKPEIRSFDDPDSEAVGVAESIRELEKLGVDLRDQAILCRSNARVAVMATTLEACGIPVLHLGSLFEREDVRDLLALLSLAVDHFSAGLVRVGALSRYGLSLQDVYAITKWLRDAGLAPIEGLAQCALEITGITKEGAVGLGRLAEDLADLSQSDTPWNFLCTYLLDRTDELRALASPTSIAEQMKAVALWQFLNFSRSPTYVGPGSPVRRLLDRVRELVLLAEERSLREVPSGALHLNAVRLMTVHASKGLEFEAVHLPGLTVQGFPAGFQGDRCPLPRGLRDDGPAPATERARHEHDAEEECLFFVALSRAKSHARLYRHENTAGGTKKRPSPYLDWLAKFVAPESSRKVGQPKSAAGADTIDVQASATQPIELSELTLYERCPRRDFYTHVLKLGTAQPPTAFLSTHNCVRDLIDWYTDPANASSLTIDGAQAILEQLWDEHGPTDHAFGAEYRALAQTLAERLIKAAPAGTPLAREPIILKLKSGDVSVTPDQISRRADGRTVIRRLNTGKKRVGELDRTEYAAYRFAADQVKAHLEVVFLTTGVSESPDITDRKLSNRRDKLELLLGKRKAGEFPADPEPIKCAGCPHFFICGAVPDGTLTID